MYRQMKQNVLNLYNILLIWFLHSIQHLLSIQQIFILYKFNNQKKHSYMHFIRDLPFDYLDNCPTIDAKYKVMFKLGSGRYSKVKMGLNLGTNQRVAIKIMNHKIQQTDVQRGYQQKTLSIFLNEVKICLEAKHKNIVQIIDFNVGGIYRTSDNKVYRIMYYVMKIAQNGQLFRLINQTDALSQKTARYIFKQLLSGLNHLHKKGFAHCDIKSQNILLDKKMNLKIADFGFSRQFIQESVKINFNSEDSIGTTKCNAPQLVNNPGQNSYHADQIDVFACGCLLFQLVMKSPPFKTSDLKDQYYKKLAGNQNNQFWQIFACKYKPSPQFKDLIQKLLNPNPKARITIQEIYKHKWFCVMSISKQEYKKELQIRLKKVLIKVRKQQQLQIKKFYIKQRSKEQIVKIESQKIFMNQLFVDKIKEIKHLLAINDPASDSSSSYQFKQDQARKQRNSQREDIVQPE